MATAVPAPAVAAPRLEAIYGRIREACPASRRWRGRGVFFYPPGGCREWHTNNWDPAGWRLYVSHTEGLSHFHWRDPATHRVTAQEERGPVARLFSLPPRGPPYLFHAISAAPGGGGGGGGRRWSVGFRLSDAEAMALLAEVASTSEADAAVLAGAGPSGAPEGGEELARS